MTLGFFLGPSGYYFPPKSFPQKTLEPTWPQDVGMLNPARDKNKNKNEIKTKKEPNKIYETKACPPTLKLRAPLRLHLHAFKKKDQKRKRLSLDTAREHPNPSERQTRMHLSQST